TSAQPSSTGNSSMIPFRNSTWPRLIAPLLHAFQHLVGHVDADDAPLGADLSGGDKAIEAAARPEIDHALSRIQCPLRERIAYTRKRLNGGRASGRPVWKWKPPRGLTATSRYFALSSSRSATASTGKASLILFPFPRLGIIPVPASRPPRQARPSGRCVQG